MKKAFVITSAVDVDSNAPLTYSTSRSHFDTDERLRQTIYTIASLDSVSNTDTTLFLVDLSENYSYYKSILQYQSNLVFVSVKEEFPEIYQRVRTHPNKSHCETLVLLKFFEKYKSKLLEHDYIFKMSGRYFLDGSFNDLFLTEHNLDKILFKTPLQFEWNDSWQYELVDNREKQGNNMLHQYCSVLYGFGKDNFHRFLDLYRVIAIFTDHPKYLKFDVETLLYFFTRDFEKDIIETDWRVYGWSGADGTFLRY